MGRVRRFIVVFALALVGCGPHTGTRIDAIAPQTAVVGVELAVMLRTAASGHVDFKYDSDVDLQHRNVKPTLTAYANGEAMFRWTPLAADVGDHRLKFTAVVDGVPASETVPVRVVAGAAPISFREPVGEGTTLDVTRTPCAVVPLLVEDTSATEVELAPGSAWSDGATLDRTGPLSGRLKFCPPKNSTQTIVPLSVVATDAGGAQAEKRYTVVLGTLAPPVPNPDPNPNPNPMQPTCDTVGPTVVHTPHPDVTLYGDPYIYATLKDADGIYDGTVFWSTTPPADPTHPDLTTMNAVYMGFLSGTLSDGDWGATIPSPVYYSTAGTQATIYYLIRTTDSDDSKTGCAYHTTYAPANGVYSFVITKAP
jgi:hypothetical protein